mmetsp:Transcript_14592/g.35595  ORF Transcript_14592/g.35595 Transcript_14592/m.35595 type:complete len:338 (+) Transcript_14592:162-1175(+)|eukprot:CAMPEP_0114497356 /NCGR_PEP_ID=MMETSP0109-20121206/6282_1 /TAXON_ID=29199 /ORGANISM="Chlorarachnion reptans, Strain CCCM449" /LENGTH=337 /DNA_ID=CAMNT_0001674735 /DNA_START=145 /DNA_END=1158 /DNA_ORIENTATION=-
MFGRRNTQTKAQHLRQGRMARTSSRTASVAKLDVGAVVDTERYPIHDLEGKRGQELIRRCKDALKKVGSVSLQGFIRNDVISKMASEVSPLISCAYQRIDIIPPYRPEDGYFVSNFPNVRNSHPLLKRIAQDMYALAADQIPKASLIQRVYDLLEVQEFIGRVYGKERLYPFADEFQAMNIMYMKDGCSQTYHYDESDGIVTLVLQEPEQGGEFEFAPYVRSKDSESFDSIKKLFDGKYPTRLIKPKAGTLNLFNGKYSMHRVRTVFGPKTRIIAVMSYDTQPGTHSNPAKNVALYGERVRKIYESRGMSCSVPTKSFSKAEEMEERKRRRQLGSKL